MRLDNGFPRCAVGRELGWSVTKTRLIETGKVGVNPIDLREMLKFYRVHDSEEIERLVKLTHACDSHCQH